jgi:reactive intermediate/imine deaminase
LEADAARILPRLGGVPAERWRARSFTHTIIGRFRRRASSPAFGARGVTMPRQTVQTDAAPQAIGTYSQAVRTGDTVYLSGQIGLIPETMTLPESIDAQVHQVFRNLQAVATAAGATLDSAVKVSVFLTDMGNFARVNEAMAKYFQPPYPARAAVGVASLPRGALVEIEAVLVIDG